MLIFPRSVIGWNIGEAAGINEASLTLFKVIDPRPDIIVLGLDQKYPRDAPFLVDFERIMKELKIKYEIHHVKHACTTFNFLNAEKRYCVGALLPPAELTSFDRLKIDEVAMRRALHEPAKKYDEDIYKRDD